MAMGKMTVNKAARFLCVMASLLVQMLTVNATLYYNWERDSDTQSESSLYETAVSMQIESSKTCLASGAHEVCQSAQITESGEAAYFHICPIDGDPCNPQKCYYSSVPLCCPNALGLNCISMSDLLVGEEIIKVTFNRVSLSGEICVLVSPAVNACDADCVPQCKSTECTNNTICDSDGTNCRCKEGYGAPGENDCCNCAVGNVTHSYYKIDGTCKVYCRSNCRTGFPGGPCITCRREGFIPPECCDCDTIGNDTHAFYKTPDGDCKPFCKQNCAVIGDSGCASCKVGYVAEPECCDCDTTGNATHAFYRTSTGECKPFCKSNCAAIGDNGCDSCNVGYVDEPECCDCDTIGNATHAFYRTSTGECKPFCKSNCDAIGDNGCVSCKVGYVDEPECCDCDTVGNATHAFYRTSTGECKPFCKSNCASLGGNGCVSCKIGYVDEPECCDCDTIGNATHAFYRTSTGECKPFCKSNCDVIGDSGCASCKVGYVDVPECCDCDTIGNATHAFYRTSTGECKPFCKQNCDIIGSNGCDQCKADYEAIPECCTSVRCDKEQDLYFLIDATASNVYFCQVVVVIQMLVAAFNPSSSSKTKISGVLFGEGDKFAPSDVFNRNMACNEVVNERLVLLINEFGRCLDNDRKPPVNPIFKSSCGQLTSAVSGLEKIADQVEVNKSRNNALVMLTDGTIDDDVDERKDVLDRLKSTTIIVGGIQGADKENLKLYSNNITVQEKPVKLGIEIVGLLNTAGVLCPDHAKNITEALKSAGSGDKINSFCNCHRKENEKYCTALKYPTCGGSVTIDYVYIPTFSKKESMSLEENILAAVESVLQKFRG